MNPGQEQRYDHPHTGGDDCTAVRLDPGLIASLWGGDLLLPAQPVSICPSNDLRHRLLVASGRRADEPDDLAERALVLADSWWRMRGRRWPCSPT